MATATSFFTQNKGSLDDVMRLLYWQYYKKLQRGFTDAEFQEACESVAGIPLTQEFEYVSTTKELDYDKYLNYAGSKIERQVASTYYIDKIYKFTVTRQEKLDNLQYEILNSWQSD